MGWVGVEGQSRGWGGWGWRARVGDGVGGGAGGHSGAQGVGKGGESRVQRSSGGREKQGSGWR